jgi:hypothetical protein
MEPDRTADAGLNRPQQQRFGNTSTDTTSATFRAIVPWCSSSLHEQQHDGANDGSTTTAQMERQDSCA